MAEELKQKAEQYAEENQIYVSEYCSYNHLVKAYIAGATENAIQWHKVSDKLPEIDVLVYLWNNVDDFPIVARRHIPYGQEKWVWDCKWGSGYTVSQLAGKDYLWKEIVLPKEV